MGFSSSKLSSEELTEFELRTHFSSAEIERLYTRFAELDRSKRGSLSASDLQLIPELCMNPLCPRIIALLTMDESDSSLSDIEEISFHTFLSTLSHFHPRASSEERMAIAFKAFDVDGDGAISKSDLSYILKLLVGENVTEEYLAVMVKNAFEGVKKDEEGRVNSLEFAKLITDASVLTINLQS